MNMDCIKQINDLSSQLQSRYDQLNKLKSDYDLIEQDILHYIEFEKYDAIAGAKLLKKLKEIRIERRKIKTEYEDTQSILGRLKNAGLHNYSRPEKHYTYRTVSIERILGD